MGSIFVRGNKLYAKLKTTEGAWIQAATGFSVGDEQQAQRWLADRERKVEAQRAAAAAGDAPGPMTVRKWAGEWLITRREAGHDWKADKGRLEHHILPIIGHLMLVDVRTHHIAELVHKIRFASDLDNKLAPRTLRNIYSVAASMFRDAAIAGKIEATPCILKSTQLGSIVDKDPEWRADAVYSRDEAETMISDPRIPFDRQMIYAFGLLAGLRPGEAAALRWRHYDPTTEPLGKLTVAKSYNAKHHIVKGTKTEAVKIIPVHPTLAAMLAEWKLSGWSAMMGTRVGSAYWSARGSLHRVSPSITEYHRVTIDGARHQIACASDP